MHRVQVQPSIVFAGQSMQRVQVQPRSGSGKKGSWASKSMLSHANALKTHHDHSMWTIAVVHTHGAECSDIQMGPCKHHSPHPTLMLRYQQQTSTMLQQLHAAQLTAAPNLLQAARRKWTKLVEHCHDAKNSLQSTSPGLAHLSTMLCAISTAVTRFTKLVHQIHTVMMWTHGLH